ncbi:MAG: YfhO family protein [Ignavibacteriales bacterium]|nr:YfhO family protein [Ignavibacteriales bacterium]
MSKAHKERSSQTKQAGIDIPFIPARYQHAAALAILLLSLIVFFYPIIFNGKAFLDVDTVASHSFDTFLKDAKQQGIFPLWNPYIFCGMPAYGSLTVGGDRLFDFTALILLKVSDIFSLILFNPAGGWVLFFYAVFMWGVYLLTYSKIRSTLPALVAALAATFSMYIIIWMMSGHNTKIAVMAFFPYILFATEKLRERFSLSYALLLVLLFHFSFLPSHVQMIFYMYLAVGVYLVFFLVKGFLKKKNTNDATPQESELQQNGEVRWKGVLRAGAVIAIASAIAFGMDADKYLSVWEYGPYSIRGSNPIVHSSQQAETKTVSGGLDYDYATAWSFAPGEMITWFVPSWYGFGVQKYKGPLTNNIEYPLNTYWGPQPFTHAPQYMGLIVVLLAIIGFWKNRKDSFVQYIGVMIVFSMLIAFGKEFSLVYDLMYRYFPMFNKFRVPSMILVLVQIFIPILAAYGMVSLFKQSEKQTTAELQKKKKNLLIALGGAVVICIGLASVYESLIPRQGVQNLFDAVFRYGLPKDKVVEQVFQQVPPNVLKELTSYNASLVSADLYIGLALILVAFGSLYFYMQGKMKATTFSVLLVFAVMFDLWRIDYKPMDPQDKKAQQQLFSAPDYVSFIQNDSSLFRTLEFENGQPPYNNMLAYWRIQSAYGYQGAKMRAYQDMVDVAGLNNPLLWGLMNVKYIITNQVDSSRAIGLVYNGAQKKVYSNLSALPRAFFVNKYEVADGLAILNKIAAMSFDPRDVAYFMEDPKIQIETPHPAAKAEFVQYGIQHLEIKTTTAGNNLLFLSETYYPQGWKAFIDGKETPIYRANYLFRAVVVPSGIHKLEMKFEPRGFYFGKNLSLATNIVVLGGLAFFGFDYWRKKRGKKVVE